MRDVVLGKIFKKGFDDQSQKENIKWKLSKNIMSLFDMATGIPLRCMCQWKLK